MQWWLWLLVAAAGLVLLVNLILAGALLRRGSAVVTEYPAGVTLAGGRRFGRVSYRIVQWVADPAGPRPCPLVVQLPGGDLGGEALCDFGAPAAALGLGGSPDLVINPIHRGLKPIGVSVGVFPGGPPVTVSLAGTRFELPLSERDAARLLGEPIGGPPVKGGR
jgi:hypothetical protein